MAKKFNTGIDLQKNAIAQAVIEALGSAPSSPVAGQLYYDTVDGCLKFRGASAWISTDASKVADGYIPLAKLATNPLARASHTGTQSVDTLTEGTTNKLFVAADRTKLDGIATGATANSSDATLLARANHTGTQSADTITDGTTNKAFTAVDETKLNGIATGATANATDAQLRDRSTHTGTQAASTISNFDTQVRTNRLDQMAQPTAAVPMNGQKLTGLGAPTAGSNDSARMVDVENAVASAAAGIDSKKSVRVVSTAQRALTGLAAIDGVTPVANDRILLVGQTAPAENGVYLAASGAWSRAPDENATGEITPGAFWFVEEGTTYAGSTWRVANSGTITLGTTGITINQFGAAVSYTAGDGLTLTGSAFEVGAGTGITVAADSVAIDTAVVVRKYAQAFGDASATVFVITHNLNTRDVTVGVYLNSGTYEEVECDIEHTTVNTITLRFATAPASSAYRVVVHG